MLILWSRLSLRGGPLNIHLVAAVKRLARQRSIRKTYAEDHTSMRRWRRLSKPIIMNAQEERAGHEC